MKYRVKSIVCIIMILFEGLFPALSLFAQTYPFDDEASIISPTSSKQTKPSVPAQLSVPPDDPLENATPDARVAHDMLSSLLQKLEEYNKQKDLQKAALTVKYIEKQINDVVTKKGTVPGLITRMRMGGVDGSRIAELQGKLVRIKHATYSQIVANILQETDKFEGYSTKNGPGGGTVACAWLVSMVLRAAGVVAPGWNENVALELTSRLIQEYGWKKIPSNGKPYSGTIKTAQMKPGDIIFWSPSEHVGIYLGDGLAFSNSSNVKKGIVHPVTGYYDGWQPRFVIRAPGG